MSTLRRTLLLAVVAFPLLGGGPPPVIVTEHGKTYHQVSTCRSLARASKTYQVSEDSAITHGLRKCSICWRAAKPKTDSWMKEGR